MSDYSSSYSKLGSKFKKVLISGLFLSILSLTSYYIGNTNSEFKYDFNERKNSEERYNEFLDLNKPDVVLPIPLYSPSSNDSLEMKIYEL